MGDTISIPDDSANNHHDKPSPPPSKIPVKGDKLESPQPPKLTTPNIKTENPKQPKQPKQKTKRCPQCKIEGRKRKLTLTNSFDCTRCDKVYCEQHIGNHDCDFDHHEHQKKLITKHNPVINFKKIDQI